MAKTINDLAKEYASNSSCMALRKGELVEYYNMEGENGYRAGANAVLSEIERIINENEDGCLALERIQLRLSELKER